MTNILHKSDLVTCDVASPQMFKFESRDTGEISGYGSIFDNIDSHGDRVKRGAFAKSLDDYRVSGSMPMMLWQHRQAEPVGRWVSMAEDDIGLRLIGQLNLATTRGKDAFEHLKAGDVNGLSIGYLVNRAVPVGTVTDLVELDLREVSIVSMPSNRSARITGVKCESRADLERLLREGGLPRAAAEKVATGGWPVLSGETADPRMESLARHAERATSEMLQLKDLFK